MMRVRNICTAILVVLSWSAIAQDIHFSQHYKTPILINPGETGIMNASARASLHYKNQWQSFGNGFKTVLFNFDMPVLRAPRSTSYYGAGLMVYRDVAGNANLSHTSVSLSGSGALNIDRTSVLSLGLRGTFHQYSIDYSRLTWGSQFDGMQYDPGIPSGEFTGVAAFGTFDFGAGLVWAYNEGNTNRFRNDDLSFNAGVSYQHAVRPGIDFTGINKDPLKSKITGHWYGELGIQNTKLSVMPNAYYAIQGKQDELVVGVLAGYVLQEGARITGYVRETQISAGVLYRYREAVIPTMFFKTSDIEFGFSYDFTASELTRTTRGFGGFELFLKFSDLQGRVFGNQKRRRYYL